MERLLPYDDLADELLEDPVDEEDPVERIALPADDLDDDDLTEEDVGLLTADTEDLTPPVRPPMLEDLVVVDATPLLVDPEAFLDLVIDELLVPAVLEEEPMPPLPADPVVESRDV